MTQMQFIAMLGIAALLGFTMGALSVMGYYQAALSQHRSKVTQTEEF